jgi:hypothetical protein
MNCPGSVALIDALKSSDGYGEADPDYRRDGTQAHALAAHCLDAGTDCWEADPEQFPELTADMMDAVQEYLTYVRSRPGTVRHIELRLHAPEFHPDAFGTLDYALEDELNTTVEIDDYKHGVGVVVDAEDNPQLMYYLYLYISKRPHIEDHWRALLTIVQPRGYHPDGTIRTWEVSVGYIRRWADEVLRPAMEATADMDYLALGQWCRFCPAKLVCPAYEGLARKAVNGSSPITYAEAQQLKMLIKAVEDATFKALSDGGDPQELGAKLVAKRADRVFKDGAPLETVFGDDAYEPRALRSPAQISKLPGGKDFVVEYAYMPTSGYRVALIDDKRAQVKLKSGAETFSAYSA